MRARSQSNDKTKSQHARPRRQQWQQRQ
uniref:Uncharacterized protein n=1 Tax=Arundo donax TaxID=35708 RepID=A0A0A9DV14_ARUDO